MADTVRIEITLEATDNTGKAIESLVGNLKKMSSSADSAGSAAEKASNKVSKFDKQAEKTSKTLQNWLKQKWQIVLEAKDKISPILSTLKSSLSSVAGKAWSITVKAVDMVTSPIRGILNLLKNPILQAGAILGVSVGLKDTIDTYKGFESAMSQVKAISGATSSQFEQLTEKAKEMGAKTKFTAEEAANAFNYMAMAGWKSADMLNGIEGIMNLAAASGEDLATTSDIVTDALTAFGLTASDADHFADVLAAASSNSNTNVGMMGETFKYVAAMAGTLGYSIEDTALAIGLMANAGIKSSQAGTELNTIFTRLSVNTSHARDTLEGLGIAFFDSNGKARPFKNILDELRVAMQGLNDQEKTEIANTIAGQRAQAGLLSMINASKADYEKLTEAVNNADGASSRMANTMLDNVQGSFTLLQSAADGAKLALGERLAPYLREFADWATESMPQVEKAISIFMDWVDGKVSEFRNKLSEVTSTDEFQNADMFGKVKILWDEIIADPFSEWWESTGKEKIASVAQDIGAGIGTALQTGLLALLGIDISQGTEEGVSIGRSFAEGFAAGFDKDTIGAAFKTAISGMIQDVGKILPGGEAPGLDTAISAMLLYKMASPVMSVGGTIGKTIFGKQAGGASLASTVVGSAAKGTGLLGMGANTAIELGAGNLAGGASLGTGALAGLGLGAIAGGVIGVGTGISGISDWVKAGQETDKDKKAMLNDTGAWKVGGVAAGAAAGAAIGSVVPVVGTAAGALIGAGVGGVAGIIGSKKRQKDYEEQVKAQEEAAKAAEQEAAAVQLLKDKAKVAGVQVETFKTSNKTLRESFTDSTVSIEEFNKVLKQASTEKLQNAFGNMTLTLQEVKDLASSIVYGGMSDEADKYTNAVDTASEALSQVKSDLSSMEKLNWKAGIGLTLSDDDKQSFKDQATQFAKDAQTYLTDKHYEAYVSLKLIAGSDVDMTGTDTAYATVKEQVQTLSSQLQQEINDALADGEIGTRTIELDGNVVEINEMEAITNLQNQISDIINKVSEAESEAGMQMLEIKYGGATMSADSFQQLQTELQEQVQTMTQTYDDATKTAIASVNLQLSLGQIDETEANAQIEELKQNYQQQIGDMNIRVEGFQLDTIADAFGSELENALDSAYPDIEGTTSEKLKAIMDSALAVSPEPVEWTQEQISEWFGLDGLDVEAQAVIGEMLQSVAESIPQQVIDQIDASTTGITFDQTQESIKTAMENSVADGVANTDLSAAFEALTPLRSSLEQNAQSTLGASMDINIPMNITYDYSVTNPTFTPPSLTVTSNGGRTITKHANGGFVGGAELSWVGEDGPEAIIPLGSKRRERGLELYEQVGEILGITKRANGGFVGGAEIIPFSSYKTGGMATSETGAYGLSTAYDAQDGLNPASDVSGGDFIGYGLEKATQGFSGVLPVSDNGETESAGGTSTESVGSTPVNVSVSMNPSFVIEGAGNKSEDEIVGILQRHIKDMADEIGGEVAERLVRAFQNMPLKGVV